MEDGELTGNVHETICRHVQVEEGLLDRGIIDRFLGVGVGWGIGFYTG